MPFTMRRVRPFFVLMATCAAVALAACGGDDGDSATATSSSGGDDREAVTAVITGYTDAFADGDFEKACDLLTDDSREQIEEAAKELDAEGCPDALEKATGSLDDKARESLRGITVTSVQIDGDRATVRTKLGGTGEEADPALVVKEDGEWRLAPADGAQDSTGTVTTP
jgi:hypothetical protein